MENNSGNVTAELTGKEKVKAYFKNLPKRYFIDAFTGLLRAPS